jgi:hypothetical protein
VLGVVVVLGEVVVGGVVVDWVVVDVVDGLLLIAATAAPPPVASAAPMTSARMSLLTGIATSFRRPRHMEAYEPETRIRGCCERAVSSL